ncbi:MAG TPA: CPBP family intramembrane glutamic endopeptidase [Flavobacterium sp.]|nr:CPBP family intramembrane glutamic endopeptidase [Flavobacterium sp.]
MYIEQLKGKGKSVWLYLPFSLIFIGFMTIQIIYTFVSGEDPNEAIQMLIDQFGKTPTFVIMILPLSVLFFILLGWIKVLHGQSIRSLTTARKKTDWRRIFFSFFLWSFYIIISTLISYWISPEDYELTFRPVPFLILAICSLLLVPLQTSFEEYFFRGYLMQGIGLAVGNRWVPLLITSVLFGLMHAGNPEILSIGPWILIQYISIGLFLGIITLMDDGLELAIGFHAANNVIISLLLTSQGVVFQTDAIFTYSGDNTASLSEIVLSLLIVFPLMLFVYAKKYGWKNWKQQLTKKF